jgi:hypothetical protein
MAENEGTPKDKLLVGMRDEESPEEFARRVIELMRAQGMVAETKKPPEDNS